MGAGNGQASTSLWQQGGEETDWRAPAQDEVARRKMRVERFWKEPRQWGEGKEMPTCHLSHSLPSPER